MAVMKNQKTGMWEVRTYYKDWTGTRRQKTKRGFAKKSETQEWECAFKLKDEMNINMKFKDFAELYLSDIQPRIKYNSFLTKKHIIETKILPYFGHRKLNEIRPADVIQWQNEIMKLKKDNGEAYSPTYLKTIHNQLSAILNHAVNMYDLKNNVARKAGSMGKEESKEIMFWTQEEYQAFIEQVADKPISYYAFEILYWTGIREGELLALTPADFDFVKKTLRINKSYQRLEGKDVITDPKTPKSNRVIVMSDFLAVEIEDFISKLDGISNDDRIFTISKSYLHHEMDRGAKLAGVKRIEIHGLRHSHISLLIHMGYSALAIAERVGHEAVDITYHYAHLFPTVGSEQADKLMNDCTKLYYNSYSSNSDKIKDFFGTDFHKGKLQWCEVKEKYTKYEVSNLVENVAITDSNKNFRVCVKDLSDLYALVMTGYILDDFGFNRLNIEEIVKGEQLTHKKNQYGLSVVNGVVFHNDYFVFENKAYLYNILTNIIPVSFGDVMPGFARVISEQREVGNILLRLDDRLALPEEQAISYSTLNLEKYRGPQFHFKDTLLKTSKTISVHFNGKTMDKLLMVVKQKFDEKENKSFWHIELETLPYRNQESKGKYCITTFLHGMYYPDEDIFTHIDYTKNQYDIDTYLNKYSDCNEDMPIDTYTSSNELHYKIWCIEGGKYSRETWYRLMVVSLNQEYVELLDEILE